jgi:hypothetical protein
LSDSSLIIIALTSLLAIAAIVFVLRVRPEDLPKVEPPSPFAHLDERKAAIYEGLRDLQFEYRLGKLSDADYQSTKTDLQKQLAAVLAEVDRIKSAGTVAPKVAAKQEPKLESNGTMAVKPAGSRCPHCGATFERTLKFCGECGKAMANV